MLTRIAGAESLRELEIAAAGVAGANSLLFETQPVGSAFKVQAYSNQTNTQRYDDDKKADGLRAKKPD